jgi:hypothetical protein
MTGEGESGIVCENLCPFCNRPLQSKTVSHKTWLLKCPVCFYILFAPIGQGQCVHLWNLDKGWKTAKKKPWITRTCRDCRVTEYYPNEEWFADVREQEITWIRRSS